MSTEPEIDDRDPRLMVARLKAAENMVELFIKGGREAVMERIELAAELGVMDARTLREQITLCAALQHYKERMFNHS